ncbi:MAG: hypothetical protein H6R41_222, partial [Deltaproteobacteria bacterium]|nr:hypothetical protein [Deltaproteobacteria bacterium]
GNMPRYRSAQPQIEDTKITEERPNNYKNPVSNIAYQPEICGHGD